MNKVDVYTIVYTNIVGIPQGYMRVVADNSNDAIHKAKRKYGMIFEAWEYEKGSIKREINQYTWKVYKKN